MNKADKHNEKHLRSDLTAVILAGGLARRMGNADKGLIELNGRPMISYVLNALKPLVKNIIINANRSQERYARFGYPVIADHTTTFDGPLAGIHSALSATECRYLLSVPCDSPLISSDMIGTLIDGMNDTDIDICVAHDGTRIHPVFLALKSSLSSSLEKYLASGKRKIDTWLYEHRVKEIDLSANAQRFQNVNTPDELAALEKSLL